MIILHVLAPAAFGGLEQVVAALATGQEARGHKVHVAAISDAFAPAPPLVGQLRSAGVTVHEIPLHGRSYVGLTRAIRQLADSIEPDVIHTHGYVPDVLLGITQRRRSPALVTTAHGFTGGDLKNRVYEWLQIRSHRRFDAVIAVSTPIRDRLTRAGVRVSQSHVVRNAIPAPPPRIPANEARRMLGIPASAFSIGWIGRLSHEKGPDVLARALPLLSDTPAHTTFIGDGSERANAVATVGSLGLVERVKFVGVMPDAARLLSAFDVLVLSSRTEGTPITLLEAMGAGVPVVATAVGGIPDVVSSSEALLVPSEDTSALAAAIRAVFTDGDAAQERAKRAQRSLETSHSTLPWLEAHDRVYASAMARRKASDSPGAVHA